jgi:hypothetical protein
MTTAATSAAVRETVKVLALRTLGISPAAVWRLVRV